MRDAGDDLGSGCCGEGRLASTSELAGTVSPALALGSRSGLFVGVVVGDVFDRLLTAWWPDPGQPIGTVYDEREERLIYQLGASAARLPHALACTTRAEWARLAPVLLLAPAGGLCLDLERPSSGLAALRAGARAAAQ